MIKQIVSIEDEAEISELLSVVLDSPQASLIQTYDAYSGLDAIRELHPDLVILDIMLPDLDGWSVYRILREEIGLLDIPVLVLTVLRREFLQPRPQLLDPRDVYMTKPFDAMHLRQEVESMLGMRLWA